ncbi:hypothetical protein SK128_004400 [Halocaridina rubra]|uniref:Uncharacterized protein n=1 Tax=Halocaridina rubra TaxID=373956 RepID=A0AAN8WL70_HALRR
MEYSSPFNDSVRIHGMYAAYKGKKDKVMTKILGKRYWLAHFNSMTIRKLSRGNKVLSIRRLSTPSTVLSSSKSATRFMWYYLNKQLNWVEFGCTGGVASSLSFFNNRLQLKRLKENFFLRL